MSSSYKLKIVFMLGALIFSSSQTACVSSKFKMVRNANEPPVINIVNDAAPLSTTIHSVIVYRGSGSWKRNAYWDEYVVSIRNTSDIPLTITDSELIDWQNIAVSPGNNPWTLEKESKEWKSVLHKSGVESLVHIGAVYTIAGNIAVGGLAGSGVLAGTFVIGLPVYAVSVVARNHSKKKKVASIFEKRRLKLPIDLSPDQQISGSLFFRISPSPKSLTLRCLSDEKTIDIAVELEALNGLHLKKSNDPKQD